MYALALQPGLLPSMLTWSEVSPKVLGGADLFLQVSQRLPATIRGQSWGSHPSARQAASALALAWQRQGRSRHFGVEGITTRLPRFWGGPRGGCSYCNAALGRTATVPAPAASCSLLQGFLLPGGAEKDLPPFLAGSLLSLRVPGNPLPFALGKMAVSRTEALREGMKGRGMEVLHVYGAPALLPPPDAPLLHPAAPFA